MPVPRWVEVHDRFVKELEAVYDVEHYHGRGFWHGPAIRVNGTGELQTAIRLTSDPLQWDTMGRDGFIVYPILSDPDHIFDCDKS